MKNGLTSLFPALAVYDFPHTQNIHDYKHKQSNVVEPPCNPVVLNRKIHYNINHISNAGKVTKIDYNKTMSTRRKQHEH